MNNYLTLVSAPALVVATAGLSPRGHRPNQYRNGHAAAPALTLRGRADGVIE